MEKEHFLSDIKIADIVKIRSELKDICKKMNIDFEIIKKELDAFEKKYLQEKNDLYKKYSVAEFIVNNAKHSTEIFMSSKHVKTIDEYKIDDIICDLEKEKTRIKLELDAFILTNNSEFELLKKKYYKYMFVLENIDRVTRNLLHCLITGNTHTNIKLQFSDNTYTDFNLIIKEILNINPIFTNICFSIDKIYTNSNNTTVNVKFFYQ
jgi:hypothetical protein